MGDTYKAEIIEDWQTFGTLESDWNGLLHKSKSDIIFLTWEWVQSWLSVGRDSVKPFVVVVRNTCNELVGLAPFYFTEYRLLRSVRYRVLRIMADFATGAECFDWIVQAEDEKKIYSRIAEALALAASKWDCIWMPYVPNWTGASDRILFACIEGGFCCHRRSVEFGFFELPEDYESFFKSLSRNRRSELRRQSKAILSDRRVVIKRCRSEGELKVFLDALFDLNHRRWQTRGMVGTFIRKPGEALFYKKFLPIALNNGWLWLYALLFDGEFEAIQVGYVYNNVFFQLQEGFSPDFVDGAGNVLRAKVIEECIANGITIYDFLGGMTEHKRRWSARPRIGQDLFIGNRNLKNSVLFAKEIWPTGRYLRPFSLPLVAESTT